MTQEENRFYRTPSDDLDRLRLENARLEAMVEFVKDKARNIRKYYNLSSAVEDGVHDIINVELSSTALRELLEPTINTLLAIENALINEEGVWLKELRLKASTERTRLESITSPTDKTSEGVEG